MTTHGPDTQPGAPVALIVDDDPDIAALVALNLCCAGFLVRTALDGREALMSARSRPPDIISTGVMMPVMDGWELLAALKADPLTTDIPVVVLASMATDDAIAHSRRLGACAHITKPFDADSFVNELTSHLPASCGRPSPGNPPVAPAEDLRRHIEILRRVANDFAEHAPLFETFEEGSYERRDANRRLADLAAAGRSCVNALRRDSLRVDVQLEAVAAPPILWHADPHCPVDARTAAFSAWVERLASVAHASE